MWETGYRHLSVHLWKMAASFQAQQYAYSKSICHSWVLSTPNNPPHSQEQTKGPSFSTVSPTLNQSSTVWSQQVAEDKIFPDSPLWLGESVRIMPRALSPAAPGGAVGQDFEEQLHRNSGSHRNGGRSMRHLYPQRFISEGWKQDALEGPAGRAGRPTEQGFSTFGSQSLLRPPSDLLHIRYLY